MTRSVTAAVSVFRGLDSSLSMPCSQFMSAGREDMDVRMLGFGRPFVFEIQNQRTAPPTEARGDAHTRLLWRYHELWNAGTD